jgi:hypothetical protein
MERHYAQQGGRLSPACRVKLLEAGTWQRSDGTAVRLRDMPDGHLVNALLKHIWLGQRDYTLPQYHAVAEMLTREVVRRNLQDYALAVAAERDGGTR